jgi:hypothetical protein
MCNAWRASAEEIRTAFGLLVAAEARLKLVFKPDSYLFDLSRESRQYRDYENPENLLKELKKDAWRAIIARIELRRVLSIARNNELDKQLESGDGLPEIDELQILAMLEGSANNVSLYIEEMTREVFDWLRPHHREPYVTNTRFEQELGRRVIIGWGCERYSGRTFTVNHHRQANFKALDNVFHALDGQGTIKSHRGELIDAICASQSGQGETKYFRFKCFQNHNVHLEFLRGDLLAKLNAVAGGLTLKQANGKV